jgi:hypothetical protein
MGMRSQDFATVAARLRQAADAFGRWAPVADAVATEKPGHVPPVITNGAPRPTEAVVFARIDSGVADELDLARSAAIQAVLNAELASSAVRSAERAYSGVHPDTVDTTQPTTRCEMSHPLTAVTHTPTGA